MELTWSLEGSAGGTGTLEIQFWKQDSLRRRISLESHLTSGECCASQGHFDDGSLQYQKEDGFTVEATNLQSDRGRSILDTPVPKRFFLYGFYLELLSLPLAG